MREKATLPFLASRISILASVLVFAGCRSGAELDLDFREQTDLAGAELIDTFSVKGQTVSYPYINTETGSTVTLGQTNDPRTGMLTATAFIGLYPPSGTTRPIDRPTNDTVIVRFPYALTSPGRGVDVTFKLYALTEAFLDNKAYFSNDRLATENDPVATVTIPQLDTVKKDRFVAFKITSDYAHNIVNYLAANGFKGQNDAGLKNLLKGFEVRVDVPNNTVISSDFSLSNARAQLKYNFHRLTRAGADTTKDTTVNLVFARRRFTHFKVDRTGSEISSATQNVDTLTVPDGRVFLQNGVPLWGFVKLPGLTSIQNDLKRVAVVKAELVLPNDYTDYKPGRNTSLLVFKKEANQRELSRNQILDNALDNEDPRAAGGINYFNDSAAGEYRINITRYVQNVFNGKQVNNGLYITLPVAERSLRPYSFSTSPLNAKRARLKLYFVRLSTGL